MRIQNTNMEFVTFENADVITTSGGFAWFQVTTSWSGNPSPSDFVFLLDGDMSIELYGANIEDQVTAALDQYYKIMPHADSSYSYSEPFMVHLYGVEAIDAPGAAKDELKSIYAIMSWIDTNCKK